VRRRSKLLRDQPEHPLDRAIYWTEYVLRHKGAYHLQSPAKDYGFVQYYLIDVIFFCLIAGYVCAKLFIKLNSITIGLFVSYVTNQQSSHEDELTKRKAEVNGFSSGPGEKTLRRNGNIVSSGNSLTVERTFSTGEDYKNGACLANGR
jgi:hypothetical protein